MNLQEKVIELDNLNIQFDSEDNKLEIDKLEWNKNFDISKNASDNNNKIILYITKWPNGTQYCFSQSVSSPTEICIEGVLVCKDIDTGKVIKISPNINLDVKMYLMAKTDCSPNIYGQDVTLKVKDKGNIGMTILKFDPIYKSPVLVKIKKHHQYKMVGNTKYKKKVIDKKNYNKTIYECGSSCIKIRGLNITAREKYPKINKARQGVEILWNYYYYLLITVDIPNNSNTPFKIGAISNRIISVISYSSKLIRSKLNDPIITYGNSIFDKINYREKYIPDYVNSPRRKSSFKKKKKRKIKPGIFPIVKNINKFGNIKEYMKLSEKELTFIYKTYKTQMKLIKHCKNNK